MNAVTTVNPQALQAFGNASTALAGASKAFLACKKGDWVFGADDTELAAGTKVAMDIMNAEWGWICWRDRKPEDRRMVAISSGQGIEPRSSLSDNDSAMWPVDDFGNPQDPWQKTIEIPGRMLDGDKDEFCAAGSSRGWEGACKALFAEFAEQAAANEGKVPVVELTASSYQHGKYGRVKVPVMKLVEWMDPNSKRKSKF